ncbi:MAG: DUF5683 domain-containing protein [Euryarchaeota archaeon]|nr:DUF5683 domain-containing protein [Euryarchaeota archaeon]
MENSQNNQIKYCPNCGAQIDYRAEICPKCGMRVSQAQVQYQPMPAKPTKSEGLAAVLSFLIPGLGQIYNGQIGKGLIMIIAAIVCGVLMLLLIGIVLYLILWVWGIYDAYNTAKKINQEATMQGMQHPGY